MDHGGVLICDLSERRNMDNYMYGALHKYVTPKSAVFDPPTHHVTIINL